MTNPEMHNPERGMVTTGLLAKVAGGVLAGSVLVGGIAYEVAHDENNDPQEAAAADSTTTTVVTEGDGIVDGREVAWHIANNTCSPDTRQDAEEVKNGTKELTNLVDRQVAMLNTDTDVAVTMAKSAEARSDTFFEAFKVTKPSDRPAEEAGKAAVEVFDNEYYVTAPLSQPTEVLNTVCEKSGEIKDYRAVTLEAGTFVGGRIIESIDGNKVTFKDDNGTLTVELNDNDLVAAVKVKALDGSEIDRLMLVLNKAGVDINGDWVADVGCMNFLNKVPAPAPETTTTSKATTTTQAQPGTTTTTMNPTTSTSTTSTSTSTTSTTTTTVTPPPSSTTTTVKPKVDDKPTPGPNNPGTTIPHPEGDPTPDDGSDNPVGGTSTTVKPRTTTTPPPTSTTRPTPSSTTVPPTTQRPAPGGGF